MAPLSFLKSPHLPLVLILAAHVALGMGFGVTTPIFEAPDEDGHYLFVRYLQVHHWLPIQTLDRNGPRAHHPPLYHLLAALLTAWVPIEGSADRIDMRTNPHVWFRYDDPDTDNKAMWVHYGPEERWPYQGQALALHLIRLLSLAFSTLSVYLTYCMAHQLRPGDNRFAFLATGLLAFNPMALFMSGVAQNNTTNLAMGALILYLLSRFAARHLQALGEQAVSPTCPRSEAERGRAAGSRGPNGVANDRVREGFTPLRWAWVGVSFSLGVLLQLGNLTLAAPIALALFAEGWRSRRVGRLVQGGLGLLAPFALLTGWWFVRNRALYGDWTGNSIVAKLWCCDVITPTQALYLFVTGLLGRFGQGLMITFPRPIYIVAGLIAFVALGGLLNRGVTGLRSASVSMKGVKTGLTSDGLASDFLLWSLHASMAVGLPVALLVYAATVAPGLPGRYMFPAFPSLTLLLAAGFLAWFGARWHGLVSVLVVALNLSAALYGLFGLLLPTYRMPRSPTQAELRQMTPLDAQMGTAARVLGYRLNTESVKAGDHLDVTVYWMPQARTGIPYTVFVHLYEPNVGSITQRDTYPGSGNYATTVWDPERPFVDTYRLRLPPDAPRLNGAKILLGLYDEQTMQRLPVAGANGSPENNWVEFGNIQVQP